MKKKWSKIGLIMIFPVFILLALKPIPRLTVEGCIEVLGVVGHIQQVGITNDISISLAGSNQNYYINRGLEHNLTIDGLTNSLLGKEVKIYHPKYWTPLDPLSNTRHVQSIKFKGEVIYSEN